jgi:hypothetical protein
MPLHLFDCGKCLHSTEELYAQNEPLPETIPCEECGEDAHIGIPLIARTQGRWGDQTGKYGVNGFYDRGLGVRYYNSMQRDAAMKAKGLEPLSDLPKHFWADETEKREKKKAAQDKVAADYLAALKTSGDKAQAVTEAMPAHKCLDGTYDNLFD